jgi:hypothetical protein
MSDARIRTHYQLDHVPDGLLTRIMRTLRAAINGKKAAPTVSPNWFYRDDRDTDFVYVPHVR